ncbi:dynamin family protein [Histophilus somni]|uniref:dynamin family protein n=1 Tax=Histophilus somni TaxID=731 RepID=UPI00201F951E|nr:dynamin family protein [Histophilus somni]
MSLLTRVKNFEVFTDKYKNEKDIYFDIRQNKKLEPVETIEKILKDYRDDKKLLRIGIVGRVKAGKSSLLNALVFDGEDVLPKAATPMTAALTIMKYNQAGNACAEVDFF